jgi:hypothetical protein
MLGRMWSRREIVDVLSRDKCFDVVDGVPETPRHTASRRRPRGRPRHVHPLGGDAPLGLAGFTDAGCAERWLHCSPPTLTSFHHHARHG